MQTFVVEFYETPDGSCPVRDFLDLLDEKMRAKTLWTLKLLAQYGNELREPYSKFLEDGIFELRVKQGTNIVRVLYFFIVDQKIIVTNGFLKKTMRTPKQEILIAQKYRREYIKRRVDL